VTFQWIAVEKARYPVRALCRTLGVSSSGYYAWAIRGRRRSPDRDLAVRHAIRVAHVESRGRYGSPRILQVLRGQGHRVGRNRVIRLMRAEGLRARRCRRFVVTTDSRHPWTPAPNHLQRHFQARHPNRGWVADLTYLDTHEGWLYLAVVIDLFSRRVVGWAIRTTLHTDLPEAALRMAIIRRQPRPGLVHHSDRGMQYASHTYRALLRAYGLTASMSRRGNCWDNAVVESFFSTLKQELGIGRWLTRADATRAVIDYIDGFYNPVRLHSTLGYQSPAAFEAAQTL
jgi:transposase InsO family protein